MDKMTELQNEALAAATEHIREQRKKTQQGKLKIICLSICGCVAIISATVLACFAIYTQQQTIIEQQYALNMQYAQLMEYIGNADIVTETTNEEDSGDGGVAIAGDENTVVGGDLNGNRKID